MAKTTLEYLRAACKLISNIDHWTQGELACDNMGMTVDTDSKYASCFCALGALKRVKADSGAYSALNKAATELYGSEISIVNDGEAESMEDKAESMDEESFYRYCHAAVLRCYDRAIAREIARNG